MLMSFVVRTVATAIALWVATVLISGLHVYEGWATYLKVAVVFGIVNGTLGTLVKFFTFPAVILTLGLFLLVVNAAMLEVTDSVMESFDIDNFVSALFGALIIAIVGAPTAALIRKPLS